MTEDDARSWIRARWGVSRETLLGHMVERIVAESEHQNLISARTVPQIWARHVVDSAQLLTFALPGPGQWLDIGTGAGFPGLVIACLRDAPVTLCEPRAKRAQFLSDLTAHLDLQDKVTVVPARVERLSGRFPVVSARAVAALPELFASAASVTDRETLWILPKGKGAREEVEAARKSWHGSFHVEQSLTDPEAQIVIATGVRRRK